MLMDVNTPSHVKHLKPSTCQYIAPKNLRLMQQVAIIIRYTLQSFENQKLGVLSTTTV